MIQHDDLEDSPNQDEPARITSSQYLTSYDWLNGANHQIIVPGENVLSTKNYLRLINILIHLYKVNRQCGRLSLSLLSFERIPANIIAIQTPRDILSTHWSR